MNREDFSRIMNENKREERWVSGLNHRFAKPAKGVILSEGSNPSLSAKDF